MDILLVHSIRVVDEVTTMNTELICMRKEWHGRGKKSKISSSASTDFSSRVALSFIVYLTAVGKMKNRSSYLLY
jgi:hypothetical protein